MGDAGKREELLGAIMGLQDDDGYWGTQQIDELRDLLAAHDAETWERAAKCCEEWGAARVKQCYDYDDENAAKECAAALRARKPSEGKGAGG